MTELNVTRKEAVSILTIDRPERRNALGNKLIEELTIALRKNDEDDVAGATVICGAAPGFCAGSDLKELAPMTLDKMVAHVEGAGRLCRSIAQLRKPVLAAVEGFAFGGGLLLAISCDIVVTARNARWHLPEVQIGWIPPWGLETLTNRVGVIRARQLAFGAYPILGDEAVRLGVADHVTGDGEAVEQATVIASRLAALPRAAIASTKLYFASRSIPGGEGGDLLAAQLYRANLQSEVARASLRKFQGAE